MFGKDLFKKPGKITIYIFIVIICLIVGIIILNSVSNFHKGDKYTEEAINNCVALCKEKLALGELLASGPCLSENIAPDWVCDSVNVPRNKFVDNLTENQCSAYKDGTNKHFVEVSITCEFIRTN